MELRHLRYFVAVAEEGSLTVAAQKRLHTAQPSLSRQIHDLELELGVQLLIRGPRGIELTPSGRVFLDHARVALLQVEAASEAARRAAQPAKSSFRRTIPECLLMASSATLSSFLLAMARTMPRRVSAFSSR